MNPILRDGRDLSWMPRAACAGQSPAVYDTDDEEKPSPEIRCFLCDVRAQCLTYALNGRESGTWGGLSRKQRDRIVARKRKRRSCPHCASESIFNLHGVGSCVSCGLSWLLEPKRKDVALNPAEV